MSQVCSEDSLAPPKQPRDRLYSSDDDYVQMNGVPSPGATLTRAFDPLKEEEPAIRRISRDYKRSSVSSSNSKVSIESLKLKHKQTIMIDSDECEMPDENGDYMPMNMSGDRMSEDRMSGDRMSGDRVVNDQRSSYEDDGEDYVESDALPAPRDEEEPVFSPKLRGEGELKKEEICAGSDTISTGTLQADVNVTEESQINAVSTLVDSLHDHEIRSHLHL